MCQISGQDIVSYEITKSFWHFQIKKFYFVILIGAKGYGRNFCFIEGFVLTTILTIALRSENSTNSLKLETRS